MERYQNLSADSGVEAYECGPGWIKVRFRDGPTYIYDGTNPGAEHVARMQDLARAGRGLSTYISRYVRKAYSGTEPGRERPSTHVTGPDAPTRPPA